MLPSTMEELKDERSKDNDELSYPVMNLLWQFSLRTGISRYMLPAFKIIIILGASITVYEEADLIQRSTVAYGTSPRGNKRFLYTRSIKFLYYLSLNWTVFVEDRSYGIAAVQGQQVRYLIESRPCPDVKKICYTVYDAVDMFTGDVNRFLVMQHIRKKQETVVRLIPPTDVRSKESDSRFWKVNHTHVNKQYVAVMLTVPFGIAALVHSNYANLVANVLIVGLGGGNMNMFLTDHFPKITITIVELDEVIVDLARRWFELNKKHEKVQIVTMDGVEFIEKAAVKKDLFDVIFIDVCEDGDLICPAESYIRPNFTENLKKILEPTGIVVLNILPNENAFDQVDQVVRAYQKQFPTCAVARLHHEMNTILACQILQQFDPHSSQRLLSQRFQEAWSHFGFIQQFGAMELSFIDGRTKT